MYKIIKKAALIAAVFIVLPAFAIPVSKHLSDKEAVNSFIGSEKPVSADHRGYYKGNNLEHFFSDSLNESPPLLAFIFGHLQGLKVDFILFAFGVIGFIIIQRRSNL